MKNLFGSQVYKFLTMPSQDITWYDIPGKLLAGIVCWFRGHVPELVELEFFVVPYVPYVHVVGFYRCTRCKRRGHHSDYNA